MMSSELFPIGYGTWAIGGDSYGKTDDKESLYALNLAIEKGVNFFDTADLYGKGHSEKLIGDVIKSKDRSKLYIASKVGYDLLDPQIQNFTSKYIYKSIDDSLLRLKTDYLDVYFLHSPNINCLIEERTFETMLKLKDAGKIKKIGISVRHIDDVLPVLKKHEYEVVQFIYNLLDQRAKENGVLEYCLKNNIVTVARVPLCFGFLTCKYKHNTTFTHNDQRSRWSMEQRNKWINTSLKIKNVFCRHGYNESMASLALKFCCDTKGITVTIPGMKTEKQVMENLKTLDMPMFSNTLLEELDTLYKQNSCIPL